MKTILAAFSKSTSAFAQAVALVLIVLGIDYVTGRHIHFPILYVLPIALAGYHGHNVLSFLLAATLPAVRFLMFRQWQQAQPLHIEFINMSILMLSLSMYSYLVSRIGWRTHLLEDKVRVLEGVLPICANCKRIRNAEGTYETMEKYITEHSEASFTHGICPDCMKVLYPDLKITSGKANQTL